MLIKILMGYEMETWMEKKMGYEMEKKMGYEMENWMEKKMGYEMEIETAMLTMMPMAIKTPKGLSMD
jgi:hypothetical protein